MNLAKLVLLGLLNGLTMLGAVTSQREGDIRLTGGQTATEGRVEIFLMSQWNGVCDDNWSILDALVVCRQLNLPWTGALSFLHGEFVPGNISYVIDNVQCDGDEKQLLDCRHSTRPNCAFGQEDAGVRCQEGSQPSYVNGSGGIRLAGGTGANSGRVEINVNGNWSTICGDQFWSTADARVVCRELGFNVTEHSAVSSTVAAVVSLPSLAEMFLCLGNESELMDCPHGISNISRSCLYAGVTCLPIITDIPEGSVRLVGSPTSGRLEVLLAGVWGTVCDNGFTRYSADVVCKELNFLNSTEGRVTVATPGTGPIWLTDVVCSGNESSLLHCAHSSQTRNCIHREDVQVTCYQYSVCRQGDIRLVNGSSSSEGRVEMCYNDAWSTICHNSWNSAAARQVCRQLNLPSTAALPYRSAFFGEGVGRISYDRVLCPNSEGRTVFDDCTYRTNPFCFHSRDAGVRCESANSLSENRIRLVGGRSPLEGRVEILLDGRWGTICDDNGWNAAAAATVCRQLGYPTNGSIALLASAFGPASSDQPMHFNDVVCSGNEAGPQACTFTMDLGGCSHSEDASVICPPPPDPQAPENFQIQLSSLDCSKVTFSWSSPNDLQFPKLLHFRIKVISLDAESISEVTVPITESMCIMDLVCGSRYISFITTYALEKPGSNSGPVFFSTNPVVMETDVTVENSQEARQLSGGGLVATIFILVLLAIISIILFTIIIVLCAKNTRITGFHSKSTDEYNLSDDIICNDELQKQPL